MTPTVTLSEQYLEHCETCTTCRPWSTCAEGARILAKYTEAAVQRIAPKPLERGQA